MAPGFEHARVGLSDDVERLRVHRVVCYALAVCTSTRPGLLCRDGHGHRRCRAPFSSPTPPSPQRTRELAAEIRRDYADAGQLHIVCVLKGAFMFLADLVRAIDDARDARFHGALELRGRHTSSGEVRLLKDLDSALEGRHVLIVEDIVDTGLTLQLPAGHPERPRPEIGANRVLPQQAVTPPGRRARGVYRIHDRGPFRRRLRSRLRGRYRNLPHIAVLEQ